MAGVAKVTIKVDVTGLGEEINISNAKTMTVPVEVQSGYTIIDGQTTALALFAMIDHIALAKIYGVYIKAESGVIYILPNTAGTTTFASTAGTLTLNEGEACWLPINPTLAGGPLGVSIDGDSATAAISWLILGKA